MSETVTITLSHYKELSALEGEVNLLKDALEKTDELLMSFERTTTVSEFKAMADQHKINEELLRDKYFW